MPLIITQSLQIFNKNTQIYSKDNVLVMKLALTRTLLLILPAGVGQKSDVATAAPTTRRFGGKIEIASCLFAMHVDCMQQRMTILDRLDYGKKGRMWIILLLQKLPLPLLPLDNNNNNSCRRSSHSHSRLKGKLHRQLQAMILLLLLMAEKQKV